MAISMLAAAPWSAQPAAAADVFTVAHLKVDVTAKTAADARAQALDEGQRRALDTLLRRLTLKVDHPRLPQLHGDQIATLVQDLAVANEKTSSVRYLAELTYRFKADEVRRLLRGLGIDFAETPSKPTLLLPVYRAAGAVSLWDEPNPWREAWAKRGGGGQLVPLILPNGDLGDIATIGAEQAVRGDAQRLAALAKRYDTSDVIVASATLGAGAQGRPSLQLSASRFGDKMTDQAIVTGITAEKGEAIPDLLARGVEELAGRIEDQWKADNLLQFERSAVLPAVVPIASLGDWIEARRRIAKVAVIEHVDLVLLTREEARLNLHFLGDVDQLALALAQADLALTEVDGTWILKLQQDPSGRPGAGRGDKS